MKKFFVILGMAALLAFITVMLFKNKQKLDNELRAQQHYMSVVPVEVVRPRMIQAEKTVEEYGTLLASAEISVLSETNGKVISITADIGDHVSQGQVLAQVEKEIVESQYILAKTNLENAEKDLGRNRKLADGDAITQQQLELSAAAYQNAKANYTALKKQLENTTIRSPVSGTIAKRSIEKGASLIPSMSLFSIVEQERMKFTVKMTETDLTVIKKGGHAVIRFDAMPQTALTGIISTVGVVPDLSGRYDVDLKIENRDRQLHAGMSGTATFEIPVQDSALAIPRKCIAGSIRDAMLFILHRDSVTLRPVTVEPFNETEVLVTNGLSPQDTIVLSGQINLRNGTKVKVIN